MCKDSNVRLSLFLFSGSLLALFVNAYLAIFLSVLACLKLLNAFSDRLPMLLRRPLCWIHSMAFEGLAVVTTFLLRPLGYFADQKTAMGPSDGRPILLVHGYLHDSSAWLFLKRAWSKAGLGPLYTINLTHPFRSIRAYAEQVAKKAEEIAQQTGRKDLVLIGHSMGGLVTSWYAAKIASSTSPIQVITIGSPLKGTHAARIALGPNGREMRRGSQFLQQVEAEVFQSSAIDLYHIASSADQVVLPASSAVTGLHPEREYLVDDIGHMTLLLSPRVAKKVTEWISPN